jgi:hypothetical protein
VNAARFMAGALVLLVTFPIWFYLLYTILKAINAGELAWFLFWIYVPATVVARIVFELAGDE